MDSFDVTSQLASHIWPLVAFYADHHELVTNAVRTFAILFAALARFKEQVRPPRSLPYLKTEAGISAYLADPRLKTPEQLAYAYRIVERSRERYGLPWPK